MRVFLLLAIVLCLVVIASGGRCKKPKKPCKTPKPPKPCKTKPPKPCKTPKPPKPCKTKPPPPPTLPPGEETICKPKGPLGYYAVSEPSGSGPCDQAKVTCDPGYTMLTCDCVSACKGNDDCDGSFINELVSGRTCIARNKKGGKGVKARALCGKVVITCSTDYGNFPRIRCPKKYKLTGCTFHSDIRHNNRKTAVKYHSPNGGYCSTQPKDFDGCDHGRCRVQARCVRNTDWYFTGCGEKVKKPCPGKPKPPCRGKK